MTRKIIRTSMNEREQEEYSFLKQRLGISDDSKALKKAIRLVHRYYDLLKHNKTSVPQEFLVIESDMIRYKQTPPEQSFADWIKDKEKQG